MRTLAGAPLARLMPWTPLCRRRPLSRRTGNPNSSKGVMTRTFYASNVINRTLGALGAGGSSELALFLNRQIKEGKCLLDLT